MLSFMFGKGAGIVSPEELSRRRQIVQTLTERSIGQMPRTPWEGLSAIAAALGARIENNRLDAAEAEGREKATAKFRALFNNPDSQMSFGPHGAGASVGNGAQANTSQQASWSTPSSNMNPVLAEVFSDPWLSEEQRSFVSSMLGSQKKSTPDMEGGVVPQFPKRRSVVRPRQSGVDQSTGGIGMNPSGTGMTVDKNGNIVGWP